MFWVVNTALKREGGYEALIDKLNRQNIEYVLVRKPPFADYLVNMEDDEELVLDLKNPVFDVVPTSMNQLSKNMGWSPGYITAPDFIECRENWGENMLNYNSTVGSLDSIEAPDGDFFVRPVLDSKSFSGCVISKENFDEWRERLMSISGYTTLPGDTQIMISPLKKIWAE